MRVGWDGWSFEVSDAWEMTDHPECLTLELSQEAALQASSAYKSAGGVTDHDLLEFAERNPEWGDARGVQCGEFTGFAFDYVDEDDAWLRCFLRNGGVLLFITYTGTPAAKKREASEVQKVLESLRAETLQ